MEARVFLRVLWSDSAMISLRSGRSLVVMACSTTVLYDSVVASRCGRAGMRVWEEARGREWQGWVGWRDSSMTRPQDFMGLLIRLSIIIDCRSDNNPLKTIQDRKEGKLGRMVHNCITSLQAPFVPFCSTSQCLSLGCLFDAPPTQSTAFQSGQILLDMKRNQSTLESSIAGCYFAVQPLSLCFLRDYDSSFNLYFEKGLQIISKNQTKHPSPRKGEVVTCQPPANIPHFRIQSDKSLEYEWSLYASQQQGDEHEQFVEGMKVSLKTAWTQYNESRLGVWEGQLEFNSIKCKLTYLVAIARSAPELHNALQGHLRLLNQPMAPLPKQPKTSLKEIEVAQEQALNEGTDRPIPRMESPKRESITQPPPAPLPEMKESKIIQDYLSPEKQPHQTPKRISATRQRDHPLSLSQLQIAEAVEREVEHYEASKVVEEKVEIIPEIPEGTEEHHVPPPTPADMGATLASNESQEIRMTHSQLLNEQREVIAPPASKFSRNRLILLGLVLAVLLSTIGYFGLKGDAVPAKKPARQKKVETPKPAKGEKQQKPTKNTKAVPNKPPQQSKPPKTAKPKGRRRVEDQA